MTNPTDTETIPVTVRHRDDQTTQVQGHPVTAGLAITPTPGLPDRYTLTHTGSGLALGPPRCGAHVAQAAATAVDWTRAADELAADSAVYHLDTALRQLCAHCPPTSPT